MQLPKELTTVTRVSKAVALLMFILLPIIGFLMGMNYQAEIDGVKQSTSSPPTDNAMPTPPCIQRPACLDATPRCMLAEPAQGWCKK